MNKKLTRDQWYELEDQMSRTPSEPGAEDAPGEHFILMALLNRFDFNTNSKWEAMKLAEELLNEGWEENTSLIAFCCMPGLFLTMHTVDCRAIVGQS